MPPSRITGVSSAQIASFNATQTSHKPAEGVARQALARRDDRHHRHEREAHQHAGDDAGQEQAPDRYIRADAVDHHRQARWDDRTDGRGRRTDRRGRFGTIACLFHRAHLDRTGARRVGDGRSHHAGEDHAGEDARVRVPAAQRSDQRGREADDAVGKLGRAEQVAHEDEQRRGNQRKRIHRLRHFLRHDRRRQAAEDDEGQRREPHRRKQRHPHQDGDQPHADDLDHQMDHSTGTSSAAAVSLDRGGCRSVSTTSLAPCSAVIAPPSTIGAYIHAMEIGRLVASRS